MWRVVGVVALLLLAGCGGVAGPDGPAEQGTLTAAPLPATPTSEPTATVPPPATTSPTPTVGEPRGDVIAPGVSEGGVFDPATLADAHAVALADDGYTTVRTTTVRAADGELLNVTRQLWVGPGGTPYRAVERTRSSILLPAPERERVEIWSNGDVPLFRVGIENVRYRVGTVTGPEGAIGDRDGRDRLAGLYASVEGWNVTIRNGPDGPHTLAARARLPVSVLDVPQGISDPETAEVRVVIAPSGRVISSLVRYDARRDGEWVEVVHRERFRPGNVTVEPPAWVDEARE